MASLPPLRQPTLSSGVFFAAAARGIKPVPKLKAVEK
jgi:hypothetical protein